MNFLKTAVILSLPGLSTLQATAQNTPAIPTTGYQTEVFFDDFSTPSLSKKWKLYKSASVVRGGVLIGRELKGGGHAAVHSVQLNSFSDVELTVDLKFEGSRLTNLTFNDQGFNGSHAGHICRVVVSPTQITLRDGKTGTFKNEIFEKKKTGPLDDATRQLLKTKEAIFPVNLQRSVWHTVTVRIQGDLMQAFIDGQLAGSLFSEGIGHATKNKVALVTPKQEVHYDNMVINVPAKP